MVIPLALSAFTHLWNIIGFPAFWYVEEIYVQRAMYVLQGLGLQDPSTTYGHPYDHPFFGQLFMAGLLKIIGYPSSSAIFSSPSLLTTQSSIVDDSILSSINALHLVPRLLIGVLAVLDTFLVYKIAGYTHTGKSNSSIALIASVLFAVMPITWLLRKVLLENILLPFLLSSIWFALYYSKGSSLKNIDGNISNSRTKRSITILISGIFLGLAILTKISAFAFIPCVCFLVYTNNNRDLKLLGLWFVPVILIPLIWPAQAVLAGQFDLWLKDIQWHMQRQDKLLLHSINVFFQIDPVVLLLGITGLIYAEIKRDFFLLLWAIPFIIFLFVIEFVQFFYLIPLIPLFCIAAARFIKGLSSRINNKKVQKTALLIGPIAVGIFGLISTTLLITTNVTSSSLALYAFIVQYLIYGDDDNNTRKDGMHNENNIDTGSQYIEGKEKEGKDNHQRVTVIGNSWTRAYYWIPKYIFNIDFDIIRLPGYVMPMPIKTERILLILDSYTLPPTYYDNEQLKKYFEWINRLNSSTQMIAAFNEKPIYYDNYDRYPYSGSMSQNYGIAATEIRANY
jgi:hypothetical protein